MLPARPLALALLLGLVALSGCVSSGDDDDLVAVNGTKEQCVADGVCGAEAVLDQATGRDLRIDLSADDVLEAPTWKIGDVFEQHVYYGSRDTSGEHIVTMVTDDSGSCYQFGTTSKDAAKFEAGFDLPFLGCIDKDLSTTAFWSDWEWMYDFPLEDGKTWSGGIDFMYNWNTNAAMEGLSFMLTATYESKINTPKGDFPGFIITGVTEDGEELLRYNYVPAVGWFSHFWFYDLTTDDTSDVVIHMMSMGRSDGFTGTYYTSEATEIIEAFSFMGGVPLFGNPAANSFTVSEDATYMQGIVVAVACPGQSHVVLKSPSNGQQQYSHDYQGDPATCAEMRQGQDIPPAETYTVHFVDQDAEAGEWTAVGAGAGIGGYFVWLWEVKETQSELTAEMLPQAAAEPAE